MLECQVTTLSLQCVFSLKITEDREADRCTTRTLERNSGERWIPDPSLQRHLSKYAKTKKVGGEIISLKWMNYSNALDSPIYGFGLLVTIPFAQTTVLLPCFIWSSFLFYTQK